MKNVLNAGRVSMFLLFAAPVVFSFSGTEAFGLEISSDVFQDDQKMPVRYTGLSDDISPPLKWKGVPTGTKSLVLIMDDPDASVGTWVHWVVCNIPGDKDSLKEGVPPEKTLPDGSIQGTNSFRRIGYGGPYPPPGPAHRYVFKLYALDAVLDLPPGADKPTVVKAMEGHILASAELVGLFGR